MNIKLTKKQRTILIRRLNRLANGGKPKELDLGICKNVCDTVQDVYWKSMGQIFESIEVSKMPFGGNIFDFQHWKGEVGEHRRTFAGFCSAWIQDGLIDG